MAKSKKDRFFARVTATAVKNGDIYRLSRMTLDANSPEWFAFKKSIGFVEARKINLDKPEYDEQGSLIIESHYCGVSDERLGNALDEMGSFSTVGISKECHSMEFLVKTAEVISESDLLDDGPIMLCMAAVVVDTEPPETVVA